jgi:hypothetical protein
VTTVDVLDALREALSASAAAGRRPQQGPAPGERQLLQAAEVVTLLAARRNVAATELCVKISSLGFYIAQLNKAWRAERDAVRAVQDASHVGRRCMPLCCWRCQGGPTWQCQRQASSDMAMAMAGQFSRTCHSWALHECRCRAIRGQVFAAVGYQLRELAQLLPPPKPSAAAFSRHYPPP